MRKIILIAACAFAVAALPAPPGLVPSHVRRSQRSPRQASILRQGHLLQADRHGDHIGGLRVDYSGGGRGANRLGPTAGAPGPGGRTRLHDVRTRSPSSAPATRRPLSLPLTPSPDASRILTRARARLSPTSCSDERGEGASTSAANAGAPGAPLAVRGGPPRERARLGLAARFRRAAAGAAPTPTTGARHGGRRGYASDPKRPFQEARRTPGRPGRTPRCAASQAALAVNPTVKGARSTSAHGATVRDLPRRCARRPLKTKPELVLVQILGNDAPCDGKDETRYTDYQARVTECAADAATACRRRASSPWATLAPSTPTSRPCRATGSAPGYACQRKGICSIFAPKTGKVVPEHVAYVRRTINGYNAAFAAAEGR